VVDVIVSIWPNFFYTVTLPCTLWFFDKSKKWTDRENKILFIDAKDIYRQIDRSHREFTDEHINQILDIVKAYRKEEGAWEYLDIKGLCKVASIDEVISQGCSLNPWRYVWAADKAEDEYDFAEKLQGLTDEFVKLSNEAHVLEWKIVWNMKSILNK
jgi:type I restriction enzyme M protein